MVDVIILYEHRTRELENACLIAAKLENIGLTTRIYNISEPCKYTMKSKVIIVPHLYNNNQLYYFCRQGDTICPCIIDMQYEQVLSEASLNGIHNPSGQAAYAYHLSWGKAQTERYLKCGIIQDKIVEFGHVGMDLLRPHYLYYFYSKEELSKEFDLDVSKSWIMFISSFSYCNLSEKTLLRYEKMFTNTRRFAKVSDMSLFELIKWFKEFVKDNPDKILIYRPHPAEHVSKELFELQEKFDNFRIISKYSVRQWMNPIDVFWNWYSTSVIDIYFAGKPCYILRPYNIPRDLEVEILVGSKFVETYEDLNKAMMSKQCVFPVSPELIEFFYGIKKDKETSDLIVELVQDLINGKRQGYSYDIENLKKGRIYHSIFKRVLNRMIFYLAVRFDLTILNLVFKYKARDFIKYKKDIYGYRSEIKLFKERFSKVL